MQLLSTKRLALIAGLIAPAFTTLSAQERTLFTWSGRVNREVSIVMRGNDLRTRRVGGTEFGDNRDRVVSSLPSDNGYVTVALRDGRGNADVIQQPNARNDYTTIIRIKDASAGADLYRLTAYWRASDRYDQGGYGRDRRRDRDGDEDDSYGRGRGRDGNGNGGYGRTGGNDGGWGRDSYSSGSLRWSGRVDDVVEIRIHGRDVEYSTLSGKRTFSTREDFSGRPLPEQSVNVRVSEREGRGQVDIVQQPNARNGYTAVIRVRDRDSGYGDYDFDVKW